MRVQTVIDNVSYPGFKFVLQPKEGALWLRVEADSNCTSSGAPLVWKGRPWRISLYATDTEIVWTCFKAVLTALEHEARELFKFKGVAVADSHVNIHNLADFIKDPRNKDGRA